MRFNRVYLGAALSCLALTACVPAPQPTPAPVPAPTPAPAPPTPVAAPAPAPTFENWMDAPATPGDWSYQSGLARFGDGPSVLALRCDRAGGYVEIIRAGPVAGQTQMIVRTEVMDRSLAAAPASSNPTSLAAQVPVHDPLLDAIAFSKGRFSVEASGLPTLYPPAYPEITRVIEDCR